MGPVDAFYLLKPTHLLIRDTDVELLKMKCPIIYAAIDVCDEPCPPRGGLLDVLPRGTTVAATVV